MTNSNARIALITGGSRGLGRSMALHLARQGVDILLTYQTRKDAAAEVVAEIAAMGRTAAALRLDAGAVASFSAFAAEVGGVLRATWGRTNFDYLINNAGMGMDGTIAETTEAQFDDLMNVHLKGVFFLTQAMLPMIRDGGRILNLSSGLARFSFPGRSAYAMMKGGIEVFTRYLAVELGARGITANTLAPGAIATDFGGGAVRDNAQLNAALAAQTPLGRVGVADDIGGVAAMLLSDAGGWINGQRIEVSGGMRA